MFCYVFSFAVQKTCESVFVLNCFFLLFGIVFVIAFHQILKFFFFFTKIECGLYFLDRFDVLMLKIIFKK
jgi:hypothetical protein